MSEGSSHRQILRSTSIVGGASVLNVLISLIRTKAAALLLGPVGVGLIGLLQNLMATASMMSALGLGNVGTRQVAEAVGRDDPVAVTAARRALFWGTLILSVLGGAIFLALHRLLAESVLGNLALSSDVAWLALGVAMTVASGSQLALLTGLRRIGDIARINVLSSLFATLLGIGALYMMGKDGLIVFVLAAPLLTLITGHVYVSRLPRTEAAVRAPFAQLMRQFTALATLGSAFMIAGLATTVGQLVVRSLVQKKLGAEALGHFQAAWAISMTYIGFVLTAMGTDYYPRLTAAIHDRALANRMVNEQSEVALLLAGPLFMLLLGLAPWVIDLLYSSRFNEAVDILRWQVLGDIMKVAGFPLAYVILASGSGRIYMLSESMAMALFIGLTWIGLPVLGIRSTGVAFVGMYAFYLLFTYTFARRRTGFRWDGRVRFQLMALIGLGVMVHFASVWDGRAGAAVGLCACAGYSVYALRRLGELSEIGVPLAAKLRRLTSKAWIVR
ncbi:O-antigen translocase [Dyella flava]|uniref:O-antigen translocase n=1 Tax=Dyella flava TaxID=1920170 RepID=UPI0024E14D4E|nr:O-antigen translocase [Dyella flava]